MKREYLFYGVGYLVFAALFLGPLGYAMKREINEKSAAEVLVEQERAAANREELASEAVEAMMHKYPERSETMAENEIPKIVRGETGQARLKQLPHGWENPTCGGIISGDWEITDGPITTDENENEYSNEEDRWIIDGSTVIPPITAPSGVYELKVFQGTCIWEGSEMGLLYTYEFEVVCFKLEVGEYIRSVIN